MKKLSLIALVLIAGVAQADFWSNCTAYGGTIITANKYGADKGGYCNDPNDTNLTNNCNGQKFCLGGKGMNWWSAFTWCESIGGKQASLSNMCPGAPQVSDYDHPNACPNLLKAINVRVWTAQGTGQNRAFQVHWNNSIYDGGGHTNRDSREFYPLCEEK
ncbi:MAG: hypothetical protein J6Y85_03535 [Alphaproteobacteria bacterium]|nr:hypothetical protein [Alphaproteobacteria bacterium]